MFIPNPSSQRPSRWDNRPIPTKGLGRVRYVIATHFSKLIKANLLFVLFSVPLVTMPAAFAAMTAVVQELFRSGQCFVWDTFIREFRTEFTARTLLSLVLLSLPVGGWFLGSSFAVWMAYALSAVLLVAVLLTGCYWFPQMATLTIRAPVCLRNALLLTAIESRRNFLLLLITCITGALTILFWPFSAPVVLIILPVFMQLLVVTVVNPVLDDRLIEQEA